MSLCWTKETLNVHIIKRKCFRRWEEVLSFKWKNKYVPFWCSFNSADSREREIKKQKDTNNAKATIVWGFHRNLFHPIKNNFHTDILTNIKVEKHIYETIPLF